MADAASIRGACESVVSLAAHSEAYGTTLRTAIGVDECASHPALTPFIRRCLREVPDVFEIGMLWREHRDAADGTKLLVGGGSPTGLSEGTDWRKRPARDSWPDVLVVQKVLSWLHWYRRVIVLSTDKRFNPGGVRALLNRQVGEVLNRDTSHGLELILILKQPNTAMETYGRGIEDYVRHTPFAPGFHERLI